MDRKSLPVKNTDVIKVIVPAKRNTPPTELDVLPVEKSPKNFINKSTIFYGASGTGKSSVIRDLMKTMSAVFPRIVVFCPTAELTKDYEGVVPDQLIYETFGLNEIKKIMEIQCEAKRNYNIANNVDTLAGIFKKIATQDQRDKARELLHRFDRQFDDIQAISDVSERKSKREAFMEFKKDSLRKFYRRVIAANKEALAKANLTEDEAVALHYSNYNPNILIIFDDAATEIKALIALGKKINDNVIFDFFFKGRHFNITHWYSVQDDKMLDTEIKKNSFINIFTDPNLADCFFKRQCMGFGTAEKNAAEQCIKTILAPTTNSDGSKNYNKFVYIRNAPQRFGYIQADLHDDFTMGSNKLHEFCDSVKRQHDTHEGKYSSVFKP